MQTIRTAAKKGKKKGKSHRHNPLPITVIIVTHHQSAYYSCPFT